MGILRGDPKRQGHCGVPNKFHHSVMSSNDQGFSNDLKKLWESKKADFIATVEARRKQMAGQAGAAATMFDTTSLGAAATGIVHGGAQELVYAGLVAFALCLKPGENVGVETDGERLLNGTIEFPDDCGAPIADFGGVGEVNSLVGHGSQRGQFFCLLFRNFLHRFPFLPGSPCERR